MVRIKGANSDYTYVGVPKEAPIQEDKTASPLFMEIFVCPNDAPSSVEANDGQCCHGTDSQCPGPKEGTKQTGHAKVRLDQAKGVSLFAKDTEALQVSDQAITAAVPLQAHQGLTVDLKVANTKTVQLQVSNSGITLQAANGAKVTLTNNGIELNPGRSQSVKITGELDLTKTTFSDATLTALATALAPKLKT